MSSTPEVPVETPGEIRQRLDRGEDLLLIDVREPEEVEIASIKGALVRPMSQAVRWIDTLPREGQLVIVCHHGMRSMHVAMALVERGHRNVTNMAGGIDLWSLEVDPSVPRY
jgi:rhodanese-related sulfurtransferase